ncbi:MAG: DUF4227 family protein [Tumebacillaceae bacterium]
MIISVRRVSRFMRMLVFVGLFSFICYKVLAIVHVMIEPTNKYKEPTGSEAVKVDADYKADSESAWQEMLDRLSVFYQIGE